MLRIVLCRASKPLKSVALSISTIVLIGWILLQYVLPIIPDFLDGAFTDFKIPSQRPLARRIQLAQLCNDFTSLGFGQAGALRFIRFPLRFIESKVLESDLSKVHTYQLSAHQRVQFKVRT